MTRPVAFLSAAFAGGAVDLTPFLLGEQPGFATSRGVQAAVATGFVADPGTYDTVLENIDRTFDPNYAAGPHFGDLVPRVPLTGGVTWPPGGVDYTLHSGTVDGFPQDYPLNGQYQTVALHSTDGIRALNNDITIRRPAEYSGARINAVLDAVGWTGGRTIAHGNCVVGPLAFDTAAWSHIVDVVNAEWGDGYLDATGFVFRSRDQIANDERSSVSQQTFTLDGNYQYSGLTMGTAELINRCTVIYNDKGDKATFPDPADEPTASQDQFGLCSKTISLPFQLRRQALQYARWIVTRYEQPVDTFATVTFTPANEPGDDFDLWTEVLKRELSDLVTINFVPLNLAVDGVTIIRDEAAPIERDVWIRNIGADFQQEPYSITWHLQDASWLAALARFDVSVFDGPDVMGL